MKISLNTWINDKNPSIIRFIQSNCVGHDDDDDNNSIQRFFTFIRYIFTARTTWWSKRNRTFSPLSPHSMNIFFHHRFQFSLNDFTWTLGQNRTWTLKIKLMIHNRSHGISRTCSLPRSQRDCEETRTILWWPMQRPWIHKPWSAILYWYLYLIPSWRK